MFVLVYSIVDESVQVEATFFQAMLFSRSLFCFSVLYAVYDSNVCQSLSTVTSSKVLGLQQRMKQLTAEGGMIFLDGDNVRGKTKFQLSKEGALWHYVEGSFNCILLRIIRTLCKQTVGHQHKSTWSLHIADASLKCVSCSAPRLHCRETFCSIFAFTKNVFPPGLDLLRIVL